MKVPLHTQKRETLISQIQNYDQQIQSYVEEDKQKTPEELKKMTTTELGDWLDSRTTELQFLIEDDINMGKNDCSSKP